MDPLAYVASVAGGSTRRRRDMRIAAVLAEFGYRTRTSPAGPELTIGPDMLDGVSEADLVVCDLVRPDRDIPVEVAIAATRGIPVIALVPAAAVLGGCTAQLLDECGATILPYERAEPHQMLHARLAARENALNRPRAGTGTTSP
jgi:hypothetical protein